MPTVLVPPPYRGPTSGVAQVDVSGDTVLACLEAVEQIHPGFLAQVLDGGGGIHRFVRLLRNDEPLDRAALETRMETSDRLEIVAAIAGG